MKKLYLDANVVLDFVLKRRPFDVAAKELFAMAEHGPAQLLVSSLTFTVVHYIVGKQLGKAAATDGVAHLFRLVTTVAVDKQVVGRALQASLPDFEDAVQLFAALAAGADAIVTRDPQGFPTNEVAVLNPLAVLQLLRTS